MKPLQVLHILDALEDEQDALAGIIDRLDGADWRRASACAGWDVADVVLHLAQTEELAAAALDGDAAAASFAASGETADDTAARWLEAERGTPPLQRRAYRNYGSTRSTLAGRLSGVSGH